MMDRVLGIDLGTTNSVAAIAIDGKVEVLDMDVGKLLPSVVGLDAQDKLIVGAAARNQWVLAPERTVRSIKRQMGSADKTRLGDVEYSPQEISAIILRTIKERAETVLGEEVRRAVITVPAYLGEQQREATRQAGELAGFEVARIINEPTAAALAYDGQSDRCEHLLVYDLGGGTFDVSIVRVERSVVEVLASHGDTHLGGDDFDTLLLDFVATRFQDEHGVDLREALVTRSRTLHACEQAKIRLSEDAYVHIEEEFITEVDGIARHLDMEIARSDYEQLIDPLLEKTLTCVEKALADADLAANKLDRVILVGGASRTPRVYELLAEKLGRPVHFEVDPDLCVAIGAGIQGAMIAGQDVGPVLVDVTPRTLGVRCLGHIHGLQTDRKFAALIARNSPLPASKSDVFLTASDGQRVVAIEVYQGEDEDVMMNELVGEFNLEGLADVARGNRIVVRFDLDINGILKVTAAEHATGLERSVVLDSVMAQFQREDGGAAAGRLDDLFTTADDTETTAATPAEAVSERVPEPAAETVVGSSFSIEGIADPLRPVVQRAMDLIDRAIVAAQQASPDDRDELDQLVAQLRVGIEVQSEDEIGKATEKLDDLLFYIQ